MKPEYSVEPGKKKREAKQIQLRYGAASRIQTQVTSAQHFLFFQTSLQLFQLTQIDKVRGLFLRTAFKSKENKTKFVVCSCSIEKIA